MLGIILLILKIIGIVLLVVLGLLILLILAILFVPIRYKIEADYHKQFKADIRFSWLLHIVAGSMKFVENELNTRVRALFFTIYDNRNEKKVKPKRKEKKTKTVFADERQKNVKKDSLEDEQPVKMEDTLLNNNVEYKDYYEEENEVPKEIEIKTQEQSADKKTFFEKIKEKISVLISKVKEIILKAVVFIKNLVTKTDNAKEKLNEKIQNVSQIISDPENKELVLFAKEQIKKLFSIIKPRKYKVDLHFGFEDIDMTGKVAMVLAFFYGLLGLDLDIKPDFENEIIEGSIKLKGNIRLFGILVIAIKCYKNKQIRKFINK